MTSRPSSGAEKNAIRRCATVPRSSSDCRFFLDERQLWGLHDTFEDLGGLTQLPGIAVQRLMANGYGFGAEGDWKTAVLVRARQRSWAAACLAATPYGRLYL